MKSYIVVFFVIAALSLEQSFASSWLVSPSRKLTAEDQREFKELQKYQETVPTKKGNGVVKPTTPTSPSSSTGTLQREADSVFSALQKKIASYSTTGKRNAYTAFIANIRDSQAKSGLSKDEKYTLEYLLGKATLALKNLPVSSTSSTGSTTTTGTTTITGKKTIGALTFAPEKFTSKTASGTILGKFSVSQNMTLHHLDLTVTSDAAIALSSTGSYILLEKDTGLMVAKTDTYTFSDSSTLKIFFDSAFLIRTGNYEIVADFKDNKNTYYQSHLDLVQTSRETQTFATKSYMLAETTLVK